jgi:hypothetical protein
MLNVISTPVVDTSGFVELVVNDDQTIGPTQRRVTRVKTLDQGVAVNDFGFSEGDRTIDLNWTPRTAAVEANVARLVKTYPQLQIATVDGVYLAAPETYTPGADQSRLRLLVLSKLSS